MRKLLHRLWSDTAGMTWTLFGLALAALTIVALWLSSGVQPTLRGGQTQIAYAEGLRVTLRLDSASMGERNIEVQIDDEAGRPVEVESLLLRFSMTEMDMGVADVEAQPVGRGRFRARGSFFSMAGRWEIEAIVGREAQAPLPVAFTFPIAASGEAGNLPTPLLDDAATLAAGRQLYATNCAACHGETGRGDGPAAAGLRPAPGDFAEHMVPGKHTDWQIFTWIRDGVPNSAMPAWGERLSDDQIWQLVTYLRTFAPQEAQATAPPTAAEPTAGPTAATAEIAEPLPPLIFTRAGALWRSDGSEAPPQQLSDLEEGSYAQYPVLSPDGEQIAFVITSQGPLGEDEWPQLNPETQLAIMDADGSDLQILWDPERGVLGQPFWRPNSQELYVSISEVSSRPDAPIIDRLYQVGRVDPASGERAVAFEDAYDLAFSPDGELVAFLRWDEDLVRFKLSVAAADGSDVRDVVAGRGFVQLASPRFSPDGRQILFVSAGGPPTDEQGYPFTQGQRSPLERVLALFEPPVAEAHGSAADLWIVNIDGSGLRRLTRLREDSPMGIFSPDGERIIILAAGGIYEMNADGTNLQKLDPIGDHGGLDWGQR